MGVTGANVPNFTGKASLSLSDLQALADVVRANMQESSPPPARVRVAGAKARPAHDVPASGVYFSGVLYERVGSHVVRPGLVEDVGWASGVDRPYIVRGHVLLPLAETAGGSGVEGSAVAGGIAGIRYGESALDAPRILRGGIIELPPLGSGVEPGGKCPLAQWGTMVESPVAGLIGGLGWVSGVEAPYAEQGKIYFPLAATVDASGIDRPSAVAGAIAGVRYASDSSVDAPRILPGGIIELPPGGGVVPGPGQECPLAQWGTMVESPVAGLIGGLGWVSGVEAPYAEQGNIYFPLAETVDVYFSERGSAVAGAIAGIRYAESSVDPSAVDAPRILPGGIIELPRPVGEIKGVRDYLGNDLSWSEVAAGAGSQVGVASINLRTAGGDVPLGLAVGFTPAGTLSFGLYNATF